MNETIELLPKYTPDYIIDEVQYYFDKINKGKSDCFGGLADSCPAVWYGEKCADGAGTAFCAGGF